jgi:heterodisulfide reductase subunit A
MSDTKHKQNESPLDSTQEEVRIGVYACYCGGNISDVVDCEKVASALRNLPNVVVSRTDISLCSDAGQAMIEADIQEQGVNRVVIGACAPALHERTFRNAVSRAGLNPYLYHHVGVREQDSWVHHNAKESATDKAIRLMMAGIAKARLLTPLDPIRLNAEKHALVIGGGVAGLRSAYDIARRGIHVTLIERTPFLGGHVAQLESTFPAGETARTLLHTLIEQVTAHPLVTVKTNTEIVGVRGYVGDFHVQIRQQPRGVSKDFAHIQEAIEACPETVPDEFNYGMTTRKAIYTAYPGCYPPTAAIDWNHCTRCGACQKFNHGGIRLNEEPETTEINVGAIVVATGFKPYDPLRGEYGYGELAEVITLPQLIRLLALSGKGEILKHNGHPVRNIGLIHCVGSRQIEDIHTPQPDGQLNTYCSRICCTATLHIANLIHEQFPDVNIVDFYRDIRTYGRSHETEYINASHNMIRFMRFHGEEPPEVVRASDSDGYPILIRVKDSLTWGEEIEVPVDLVVLSVGMMPNPIDDIINLLKINAGTDRFLLEVHPKLRPVETAVPGVVIAGTAQAPMNIQESCATASAAASKVSILLSQGSVELQPFVARVNPDRCNGSGQCVTICRYEDAITLESEFIDGHEVQRAVVTPANCVGCGACVSACPNQAIDIQGWTLDQYDAMIDALVEPIPELELEG